MSVTTVILVSFAPHKILIIIATKNTVIINLTSVKNIHLFQIAKSSDFMCFKTFFVYKVIDFPQNIEIVKINNRSVFPKIR